MGYGETFSRRTLPTEYYWEKLCAVKGRKVF